MTKARVTVDCYMLEAGSEKKNPWQEKIVAPLIANLIRYSQCKDRVTKSEGKRTATGNISDSFA